MRPPQELFDRVYRDNPDTYGDAPSEWLVACVDQLYPSDVSRRRLRALDLAAGPGRDALALASRGIHVTAVDVSASGLSQLRESARARDLGERIDTRRGDMRAFNFGTARWDVIVATTAFDHVPRDDFAALLPKITRSLTPGGLLYVEVHTTEDPGSPTGLGPLLGLPASETADGVQHYFAPNELLHRLSEWLRVLRYEERREWDTTHGRPHAHGKARAIALPHGRLAPLLGDDPRDAR